VGSSDPTRAAVKAGRFQDDEIAKGVTIAVMNGTLDDPDYMDGNVDLKRTMYQVGFSVPAREIGGTEMWWRRGSIQLNCSFVMSSLTEDQARRAAGKVMGRIERCIPKVRVSDLRDPYGEHAVLVFLYGNTYFQSGGPPTSYIWRGKALWQVLTERNPT
jgi:hypothetical protein